MTETPLMTIGTFARRTGLTPSALRFYSDSGLLVPAEIDPTSGYRSYDEQQIDGAIRLRQLREMGMPLAEVRRVLHAPSATAEEIIDEHVRTILHDAADTRRAAERLKATLGDQVPRPLATARGPILATAIEQVITATTNEPEMPVLGGVRVEIDSDTITLTATDRYRLSSRTLSVEGAATADWAGTIHAADLQSILADLRRTSAVAIESTDSSLVFRMPDRDEARCPLHTEEFPDHRRMLAAIPTTTTRFTVAKVALLQALEESLADTVLLNIGDGTVEITDAAGFRTALAAETSGPPLSIWFAQTVIYPATAVAIGADLMVELSAADQPATIRSADHGDLTTVLMPCRPTDDQ